MEQRGDDAQGFRAGVEHSGKTRETGFVLVFAKLPRLVLYDVLVDTTHERPDVLQSPRKLVAGKELVGATNHVRSQFGDRIVARSTRRLGRGIRNLFAEVARDHRERPAGQVTEIVGQI